VLARSVCEIPGRMSSAASSFLVNSGIETQVRSGYGNMRVRRYGPSASEGMIFETARKLRRPGGMTLAVLLRRPLAESGRPGKDAAPPSMADSSRPSSETTNIFR